MTTATLLFSTLSDESPATPPTGYSLVAGGDSAFIASGLFQGYSAVPATWRYDTEMTGTVISAGVTLPPTVSGSNCGASLVDSSGNGYFILTGTSANNFRVYKLAAGDADYGTLLFTNATAPIANALVELRRDTTSDTLSVWQNGSQIGSSFVDSTSAPTYAGATSQGGQLASMTAEYSSGVSISSIDQILAGSNSEIIFSGNYAVTGATITDDSANDLAISSFTGADDTFVFAVPDLVGDVAGIKLGAVNVVATDGATPTAAFAGVYTKTGYTAVTLTSVDEGHIGQGFSPALAIGDQIATEHGTISLGGKYTDTLELYTGDQTAWHWSDSDGKWRSFTITTIDGEVVDTTNMLSLRGLTISGITVRGL